MEAGILHMGEYCNMATGSDLQSQTCLMSIMMFKFGQWHGTRSQVSLQTVASPKVVSPHTGDSATTYQWNTMHALTPVASQGRHLWGVDCHRGKCSDAQEGGAEPGVRTAEQCLPCFPRHSRLSAARSYVLARVWEGKGVISIHTPRLSTLGSRVAQGTRGLGIT